VKIALAALGWLLALPFVSAAAQEDPSFPNRAIHIVVPFPAGGPADLVSRVIGQKMSESFGVPVIIDNRPGGNSNIGHDLAARAAPDGYTISIGHVGTHVANGTIYKNLNYSLLTDLEPIARLPQNPLLVVSSEQVPAKTLKELVDHLKANGDKVPGGTAGLGSASHLGALAFFGATGSKFQLGPYRGTGPAMQDLVANQIQVMIDQSANSLPQVRAGKIKAFAVTSKARNAAAPEIPTAAEAGYPMDVSIWHGLWAPKGTPPEIVARLNTAAIATLQDPDIRRRMEDLGQDLPTAAEMAPAAFAAFHKEEYARWQKILEAANVKVE
jgi:tripartite-type tricarboxylate transporter receptor subunit TctC